MHISDKVTKNALVIICQIMFCNKVSQTTVNWNNKYMKSFGSQLATTGLTSQCTSTKTHTTKYCIIIVLDQFPENFVYVIPTASIRCSILISIYFYADTSMRCPLKAYVPVPYPAPFPTAPPRPPADPSHQVPPGLLAKIFYVHFLIHLIILICYWELF